MDKIRLIIAREYLTRVKKKSFLIMTILGPILMAALMIAPIYISTISSEEKTVGIVDESGFFTAGFEDTKAVKFKTLNLEIDDAKKNYNQLGVDLILYIPQPSYTFPHHIILFSTKQPGMNVESYIRNSINNDLRQLRLKKEGIAPDIIEKIKSSIEVNTVKLKEDGTEEEQMAARDLILGLVAGIAIYFFIFMYGAMVMRGVIEEKTNRIIEVLVSSVKPFQLMMGKIVGVALVGLTQFLLWVVLTLTLVMGAQFAFKDQLAELQTDNIQNVSQTMGANNPTEMTFENSAAIEALDAISTINFPVIIGGFLFYFLFGYLLYSALFAAVGSAVDNETDTQQFMLPLTVPLILSIMLAQNIASDPDGPLSFWLSTIPFTSPIAMMIRIPFGVPVWQLALSMFLVILGFIAATWFAAKIYRTGILMYGKKPTYKEIWKWFRH
ncbi:MAG: ABC transporter permease [Bacteroidales bacterium]|nr:ABC transporter permease [Bacteroidales bacterium]